MNVLEGRERVFRAVTRAVVPESAALAEAGWAAGLAVVEGVLAGRPPAVKRQLRLFLVILERGAVLRFGRPLSSLATPDAERYLRFYERSRVPLLRKGFWGVRTLALMGYYARPEGAASVGYRAAAGGWSART